MAVIGWWQWLDGECPSQDSPYSAFAAAAYDRRGRTSDKGRTVSCRRPSSRGVPGPSIGSTRIRSSKPDHPIETIGGTLLWSVYFLMRVAVAIGV